MDDESELLERARGGDLRAFELLVTRHRQAALRVAYALVAMEAEDVVQEAFVKAHRALPRFRRDAPFRPWLLRIVSNEARNHRRHRGRQTALALREGARRPTPDSGTPESMVIDAEDRRHLVEAISRLRPADREVIALRWFVGLGEADMAIAMRCRPGTVKSRLSRALIRLRSELSQEEVR